MWWDEQWAVWLAALKADQSDWWAIQTAACLAGVMVVSTVEK